VFSVLAVGAVALVGADHSDDNSDGPGGLSGTHQCAQVSAW